MRYLLLTIFLVTRQQPTKAKKPAKVTKVNLPTQKKEEKKPPKKTETQVKKVVSVADARKNKMPANLAKAKAAATKKKLGK